jgi:hypothetical protein
MVSWIGNIEYDAAPEKATAMLDDLAKRFADLWQRTADQPLADVCAQIDGDQLLFTLSSVLTTAHWVMASTDEGCAVLLCEVSRSLDQIYSPLADAIERNLHCYVGAMHVELESEERLILVQFHLREAPGLWRLTQPDSRCL